MIIDIHCHVPRSPFLPAIREWTEKWEQIGIHSIGSMAMNLNQSRINIELAKEYSLLLSGVGIHPWKVKRNLTAEEIEELNILIRSADMVGEIGLDYYFVKKKERYPLQKKVFRELIEMTGKGRKPSSIHCVGAEQDIYTIITTTSIDPCLLSFHWYSGAGSYLRKFSDLGCYFSINPAIAKSKGHQKILEMVPENQWLTESDGNVKYDGIMGEPTIVKTMVLPTIARLTHKEVDELKGLVFSNFEMFMRLR